MSIFDRIRDTADDVRDTVGDAVDSVTGGDENDDSGSGSTSDDQPSGGFSDVDGGTGRATTPDSETGEQEITGESPEQPDGGISIDTGGSSGSSSSGGSSGSTGSTDNGKIRDSVPLDDPSQGEIGDPDQAQEIVEETDTDPSNVPDFDSGSSGSSSGSSSSRNEHTATLESPDSEPESGTQDDPEGFGDDSQDRPAVIREELDEQGNVIDRQEYDRRWRAPLTSTPDQELDPINPDAPEPVQDMQEARQQQQREIRSANFQRRQAELREETTRNRIQRLEQADEDSRYRVSDELAENVRDHRDVDVTVGDDNLVSREMLLDYRQNQANQLDQAQRELEAFSADASENLDRIQSDIDTTRNNTTDQDEGSALQQWREGDPLAADGSMTAPGDTPPEFQEGPENYYAYPDYYGGTQVDQPEIYQQDRYQQYLDASQEELARMPSASTYGLNVEERVEDATGNQNLARGVGLAAATGYTAYQAPLAADALFQQAARDPEGAVERVRESIGASGRTLAGTQGVGDVGTAVLASPGSRLAEQQEFQTQLAGSQLAMGGTTNYGIRTLRGAGVAAARASTATRTGREFQSVETPASTRSLQREFQDVADEDLPYMGEPDTPTEGVEPVRAPRYNTYRSRLEDRRETEGLEQTGESIDEFARREMTGEDEFIPESTGEPISGGPETGFTQNELEVLGRQEIGFEDVNPRRETETGGFESAQIGDRQLVADAELAQSASVTSRISDSVENFIDADQLGSFPGQLVPQRVNPDAEVSDLDPSLSPRRRDTSRNPDIDPVGRRPQSDFDLGRPTRTGDASDVSGYSRLDDFTGLGAGSATAVGTSEVERSRSESRQSPVGAQDERQRDTVALQEDVVSDQGLTAASLMQQDTAPGRPGGDQTTQSPTRTPGRSRRRGFPPVPGPSIDRPSPDPTDQDQGGNQDPGSEQPEYAPSLAAGVYDIRVSEDEFDSEEEFTGLETRPIVVDTEEGTMETGNGDRNGNGNGNGDDPLRNDLA